MRTQHSLAPTFYPFPCQRILMLYFRNGLSALGRLSMMLGSESPSTSSQRPSRKTSLNQLARTRPVTPFTHTHSDVDISFSGLAAVPVCLSSVYDIEHSCWLDSLRSSDCRMTGRSSLLPKVRIRQLIQHYAYGESGSNMRHLTQTSKTIHTSQSASNRPQTSHCVPL